MPRLQNNNIGAVNSKQGNAPKMGSYVSEVKATKDYRMVDTAKTFLKNGITNIANNVMSNINQGLQNLNNKTQQLEAENKFNEYQMEYDNLTKQYQMDYSKQPDDKLTEAYQKNTEDLKNKYEKLIPTQFRGDFLQRINQTNRLVDLDLEFFRDEAKCNYQNTIFVDNTNKSLQRVSDFAMKGDDKSLLNEIVLLPQKKESFLKIYGDVEGNNFYNDYTNKFLKNIINGKLVNKPNEVLDLTKIIEMSPEFKDKLSKEDLEQYKKIAMERQVVLDRAKLEQQDIENAVLTGDIFRDIATGKITAYNDLLDRLKVSKADEETCKTALQMAGFPTDLPTDLLEGIRQLESERQSKTPPLEGMVTQQKEGQRTSTKGRLVKSSIENELRRTKTPLEQEEYKEMLSRTAFSLLEGREVLEDKEFTKEGTRNTVGTRIKEFQKKLNMGLAGKYITEAEYEKFRDELDPYISQVLDATAKGNFSDELKGFIHDKDIGYTDLTEEINKVLTLNKLPTDVNEIKNEKDKRRYYFLKNNITNNFIKSMEMQFEKEKAGYSKFINANVKNWVDYQRYASKSMKKRMYQTALDYAIEEYAREEYNIDTTPYRNEKGELIRDDLKKEIEKKETQKLVGQLNYVLSR